MTTLEDYEKALPEDERVSFKETIKWIYTVSYNVVGSISDMLDGKDDAGKLKTAKGCFSAVCKDAGTNKFFVGSSATAKLLREVRNAALTEALTK